MIEAMDAMNPPAPRSAPDVRGEPQRRGRIEELRDILAKAAARNEELQHVLEELGGEIVKALGCENERPVWGELKAADGERQQGPNFVLADRWLRGDLIIAVSPDQSFPVGIAVRVARNKTHEATLNHERSQTLVIDPPEEKDRAEAHKKFIERVFANLESQVRDRVALPPD